MSTKPVTDFQHRLLVTLSKRPNGYCSTSELAARLKTSRLAVVSAGRSLEKLGHVCEFRGGRDQWASLMLAIKVSGREIALGVEGKKNG